MEKPGLKPEVLKLTLSLSIAVLVAILLVLSDEVDIWRALPVATLVFIALYATSKHIK